MRQVPLINTDPNEGVWPEAGFTPSVEFRGVSFSYPTRPQQQVRMTSLSLSLSLSIAISLSPSPQVLRGVSFSIAAGQTVAIVGASGSGKSTVGHLLTRLYDVTDGQVSLGGVVCTIFLSLCLR